VLAIGVAARINGANSGHDPQRLLIKSRTMRASPFAFLRGNCALFHARRRLQGDSCGVGLPRPAFGNNILTSIKAIGNVARDRE
jgi:hypothetical protein